jgi:hypothetical protein
MSHRVESHRLRGAANPRAKLDAAQVARIKDSPMPSRILARIYRVNDRTIRKIRSGERWD